MPLNDEARNRFVYHAPTPETVKVHEQVRARATEYAEWLADNIPAGRHQSLALTALQETMFWANAAVACDTVHPA